jgi:chromosome segregation ATPase
VKTLQKRIETREALITSAKARLDRVEQSLTNLRNKVENARLSGDIDKAVKFQGELVELTATKTAAAEVLAATEGKEAFTLAELKAAWETRSAEIVASLAVHDTQIEAAITALRAAYTGYLQQHAQLSTEPDQWIYLQRYTEQPPLITSSGIRLLFDPKIPLNPKLAAIGELLRRTQ